MMQHDQTPSSRDGVSRRDFLKGLGLAGGAGVVHGLLPHTAHAEPETATEGVQTIPAGGAAFTLRVNGTDHQVRAAPSTTLLQVLREKLGLTGSKKVCDRGACGGCSVLLNGRAVNSCMVLAVDAIGADVKTVEGLGSGDRLDPVQDAFIRHDACQCGYCTPGFVIRTRALLNENPHPDLPAIRRGLAGNICRCGAYTKIFEAVQDVAGRSPA